MPESSIASKHSSSNLAARRRFAGAKAFRGLSTYDPRSGAWKQLPAPRYNRDHFDAVLVDDSKLVVASGRDTPRGCTTSNKDPEGFNCTGRPNIFHYTVAPVEVFDLRTGQWSVGANITTPRAGAMALVAPFDGTAQRVVVAGGERDTQQDGFRTVEAYDPATNDWVSMPSMIVGKWRTTLREAITHRHTRKNRHTVRI